MGGPQIHVSGPQIHLGGPWIQLGGSRGKLGGSGSLMVGLLSLLGGPSIPPGAPSGGVSNGNYRKNDNSLMVVPSVNVPHGAAAQKHPKLMAPPLPTAQTPWRNWLVFWRSTPHVDTFRQFSNFVLEVEMGVKLRSKT